MTAPGRVPALTRALLMQCCAAVLFIFLLCVGAAGPLVHAATSDNGAALLERGVKAAFLYKFLSYVEWPPPSFPAPGSPYVISVLGDDAIADELSRITTSRSINNRSIKIKRLDNAEALEDVHVLFIGQSERHRMAQLLKQAPQRRILTVTETEGALALGSAINFRFVEGRIRFEVSLDAAEKSELKLSSRLLSVALSVQAGAQR